MFKIRGVTNQRPVCQTGLCDDLDEGNTSASLEIQEASNLSMDPKKMQEEEFCAMCKAIVQVATTIRKKFTIMVLVLCFFQIGLELIYWFS